MLLVNIALLYAIKDILPTQTAIYIIFIFLLISLCRHHSEDQFSYDPISLYKTD